MAAKEGGENCFEPGRVWREFSGVDVVFAVEVVLEGVVLVLE